MRTFDIKLKNSIFSRSVLTFLLILIPMYALSGLIYNWGIRTIREEIINTTQSQVSSYLKNLEADIARIRTLQYDCMSDDNLYTMAVLSKTMNNYDVARTELALQQRLKAIMNSSSYISNAGIYIKPVDLTISALSIDHGISGNISKLLTGPEDPDYRLNISNNVLILTASSPHSRNNPDKLPTFTIAVELSVSELKRAMQQFDDNKSSVSFLLNPDENMFISRQADSIMLKVFRAEASKRFNSGETGNFTVKTGGKSYLVIYTKSDNLNIMLTKCIPEDAVFGKLKNYRLLFWLLTVTALILAFLFSSSLYNNIHKPMVKIVKALHKVEAGDLSIRIEHRHNDEFRYLYDRFNAMAENLNTLIDQMYKQKILAQRAELKHLQSQVNPHFLYNSFFTLNNMFVNGDYEFVEYFTRQLGNYFKYITRSSADEVPLSREVDHSRTYAQIQARRFRNRITLEYGELPAEFSGIIVPRLVMQPLLENVFEHGLKNKVSGGIVRVSFVPASGKLIIRIEDNGDEVGDNDIDMISQRLESEDELVESTGIINIHRRIVMKFGPDSGVKVGRSGYGGLMVEVTIPVGGNTDVQTLDS